MARPHKDGMDYFPHDTDAINDEKIEVLRALYGNDGYAFYFILLEKIYRTKDFELNISAAETRQILSRKLSVTEQQFAEMLNTALKWGCFDADVYEARQVLTSNGIKKRTIVVTEKRDKMRGIYQTNVSASETRQKLVRNTSESTQRKEKKRKEKIKENIYKNNYAEVVCLTESEYEKLKTNHGEKATLS